MLADRISAQLARTEKRYSADTWLTDYLLPSVEQFSYMGNTYTTGLRTSYGDGIRAQEISQTLPGYAMALRACPPAFAAQMVRALVISQARFTFRNLPSSKTPRKLFGTRALVPLEHPAPSVTTGEMLARMEWHAGLAGNAYVYRQPDRLRVLRPDWVAVVFGSNLEPDDPAFALDSKIVGFAYANQGLHSGNKVHTLLPGEVAHFCPLPDPEMSHIGMSWITPAIREIQNDRAASDHKLRFYSQGATPNLVIKGLTATTKAQFDEIVEMLEARHAGVANAFKTLYLTAGADATVIGSNFKDMDLKAIVGSGETRISVLSRVPAAILGISEGLAGSSLNAGNFDSARRLFADTWVYPTLQDLAGSLADIIDVPSDAELWFDAVDMPLLREDAKVAAEIFDLQVKSITVAVREGFTAQSSVAATVGQNPTLLKHSGLTSVQLQPPVTEGAAPAGMDPLTALGAAVKPDASAPPGKATPPSGGPTTRSAGIDEYDDDEPGQFDEVMEAFSVALAELIGGEGRAKYDAASDPLFEIKHPRGGHGRFRTVLARAMNVLQQWVRGEGDDHPLTREGLTVPQLRMLARRDFGLTVRRGTPRNPVTAEEIEKQILDHVREHVRVERDQKAETGPKTAKFTLQGLNPEKVREVEVENKIRAAYRDLQRRPGDWVALADVRDQTTDADRSEVDAALKRMALQPGSHVIPWDNRKALTKRDHDASVRIGGDESHAIRLEDPSDRPLPKSRRDLDVAVYRDKDGKPALFEENDRGERGALVQRFDSLEDLEAWATDNGEPRLAEWARKERGGKAPEKAAPKPPAKKATPAPKLERELAQARLDLAERLADETDDGVLSANIWKSEGDPAALRQLADGYEAGAREYETQAEENPASRERLLALAADRRRGAAALRRAADESDRLAATSAKKASPAKRTPGKAVPAAKVSDDFDARLKRASAGDDALAATTYARGADARTDDALDHYVQGGYIGVNEDLRAGILDDPRTAETIKTIDSAMAQSILLTDIAVTRGTRGRRSPEKFFGSGWRDRDLSGATFMDEAFVSTSANVGATGRTHFTGSGGVRMSILAPKGTHAVTVSSSGEAEILLDRGLTFRVAHDRGVIDGVRHLDIEVVSGSRAKTPEPGKAEAAPDLAAIAKAVRDANSRQEADAHLEGLSIAQLKQLAAEHDFPLSGGKSEADLRKDISDTAMFKAIFDQTGTSSFAQSMGQRPDRADLRPAAKKSTPPSVGLPDLTGEDLRDALDLRKIEGPDGLKALLKARGLPVSGRKRALVDRLVEAVGTGGKTDLTGEGGLSDDPAVREVQIENKIRAAYLKILDGKPAGLSEWIGFADLREAVDDVPRAELDSVLKKMLRAADYNDAGRVRMIPVANTKALKPRDWAAALPYGDDRLDAISFGDPSLRPLPEATLDTLADLPLADLKARAIALDIPNAANLTREQLLAALRGTRAPAKPTPIHDLFTAEDATIEAALRDVFEGKFGPYTTKVKVDITRAGTKTSKAGRVTRVEPSIGVSGEIFDADGNKIGHFSHVVESVDLYYPDGTVRREVWAYIPIVELGGGDEDPNPTKYHGTGFGRALNQRAFDWYRSSGVHGISLHDHNGYVWAAQGFDFAGGIMPDYKQQEMRELIDNLRAGRTKNKYGETIPKALRDAPNLAEQLAAAEDLLRRARTIKPGEPGYPTAYELSQLGRRRGQRGKTALWFGKVLRVTAEQMILNPDEGEVISQ